MEIFHCSTKIFSGPGALDALGELHIGRLFLVCDPFFEKNGQAQVIVRAAKCQQAHIFHRVVPDPSVELAARGAAEVRHFAPDTVIALGGGSAMDCAKAMTFFSGVDATLVTIPTTSGSGSEVTDFAILTHDGVKHPLIDESIRPDVAILDPELVASLPPTLVAEGGFDLISHAVEAFCATGAGTVTDLLAVKALTTALGSLADSHRGDVRPRGEIHLAATLAGIAFSRAGLGLCHAISHVLGGELHIPHGRLNAILLPAVMDVNASACLPRYAELSRALGLSSGSDAMAFRALKTALQRLRRTLGLPETLTQAGASREQVLGKLDSLVAGALADPCCTTNPLPVNGETVRAVMLSVLGHG